MGKYPLTTLNDKIFIKHGFPFKSEFFASTGEYILLTPGNFFEEGGFKREKGKEKFYIGAIPSDYILGKHDLVVAMTEQAEGLLGSCAFVPEDNIYLHNQRLGLISTNDELDSRFVYYLYQTKYVREQIRLTSSGSKVKHTSPERLASVRVLLPNKDMQQAIARCLSALDAKIDCNSRINAELEAMAKTLYEYWFVQFDFPDANGKPYKSSGGKMVYNATLKRDIPKGWEVKDIFSAFDVCYGYPFNTEYFSDNNTLMPVVRIRDILSCSISAYTTENVATKYWLKTTDLVIGMDGNFHMNFWASDKALLNQRCVKISKSKYYSPLQAYFATAPYIKAREKNVSRTTVGHLSAKDMQRLNILSAPEQLQKNITQAFDILLEKMCMNKLENHELAKLRDWLLPMLMNGQANVDII